MVNWAGQLLILLYVSDRRTLKLTKPNIVMSSLIKNGRYRPTLHILTQRIITVVVVGQDFFLQKCLTLLQIFMKPCRSMFFLMCVLRAARCRFLSVIMAARKFDKVSLASPLSSLVPHLKPSKVFSDRHSDSALYKHGNGDSANA